MCQILFSVTTKRIYGKYRRLKSFKLPFAKPIRLADLNSEYQFTTTSETDRRWH